MRGKGYRVFAIQVSRKNQAGSADLRDVQSWGNEEPEGRLPVHSTRTSGET